MAATLLVADDSVTIQRVIELTFADEPVRVVTAGDGQAALQKIDADRPDIVLADVGMPRVDGYAVAAHVKQTPSLRHIPVVLLTGAFEPIDEDRARATGCDGIMVKPFEPQALVARVRELLGGQRSAALWPAELPRVEAPRLAERPVLRQPETAVITPPPVAPRPAVDLPVVAVPPPAPPKPVAAPVVLMPPPPPAPVTPLPAMASHDPFESELDLLDEAFAKLDPTAIPRTLDAETASDFARDLHELRSDRVTPSPVSTGDVIREDAAPAGAGFDGWDLPSRGRAGDTIEVEDVEHVEQIEPVAVAPAAPPVPLTARVPEPAPAAPAPPVEPVAPPENVAPVTPAAPVVAMPPPAAIESPAVAPAPVVSHVPVAVAAPVTPEAPAAPPAPPPPVTKPSLATAFSALLAAERAQPARRPLAGAASLSEAAVEDVVKQVLARMTDTKVQQVVLEVAERVIKEEIARIKTNPPNA